MKSVVAGGSGFIGRALVADLLGSGEVVVLSRNPEKVRRGRGVLWDAKGPGAWEAELDGADLVVNLAGESLDGRWTANKKRRLIESRVDATAALVTALGRSPRPERTFISASAVGIYGDRGDERLGDGAPAGEGFLADLCRAWEEAAQRASSSARLVIGRFGVVLGREGGALPRMAQPIRFFVGGRVSSGRQWLSWIDRRDVVRFMRWAAATPSARGVYNVTSPNPVPNREFTATLAAVLHRPALVPAPAAAIRIVLGEMGDALLLASQRVQPDRLLAEGFTFAFADLRRSLETIYMR
ncbi:MAG: TIGR01777 family oxidoreductase [Thermoanaerobaculia bacterium]